MTITVVKPELLLQLADLDAHFVPQLGVEIGQRLVEQQDVGLDHERARERHALLLAARQLARQALGKAFEPHEAQHLREPRRRSAPAAILRILQPERDVLAPR